MKIQLENINSFITAAEQGSFSAAGRELKKTQAAVSLAIQNLEIDLGFQLFDRTNQYPRLTQKGEQLLRNAKLMMSHYNSFIESSKTIYTMNDVKIQIGVDPLVCGPDVIQIIRDFSEAFPNVELFLMQQSSALLAKEVHAKHLDLALGIFQFENKLNFEFTTAFHMNSSWVASPTYLNTKSDVISYHDFCQLRLLVPGNIDDLGLSEIKSASQLWHVEDIHTILSLCRTDMGVSCLPDFVLKQDLELQRLRKISFSFNKLKNNYWKASLIWPKSTLLTPALMWLQKRLTDIDIL
ncbi:LysR family transcriptional regulator [Photobacterium indicum]|uniref:LysR family transcriptional regulator n=1 Tax=Photobacterium indicum TaxID=81447 RepID=UPI003D140C40